MPSRYFPRAAEAFHILKDWTPDLLLSDINMPEEDGYSFIGKIRKDGRTFPAVAVTAYGQWEDRVKTLSSGFQTHVAKPVEPRELIAIVASLTGRMSMMSSRRRPPARATTASSGS